VSTGAVHCDLGRFKRLGDGRTSQEVPYCLEGCEVTKQKVLAILISYRQGGNGLSTAQSKNIF